MATLTYKDGHVIDLANVTGFELKVHPGDIKNFHIHATGTGIVTSIWKKPNLETVARDRKDLVLFVLEEGKDVKEDDVTGRIVPDE